MEFYSKLGDPTEIPLIYAKENSPEIFHLFLDKIPTDTDLLIVKVASGLVLPITKGKLKILKFDKPEPGDVVIFKQSDLHRGFHNNGIRIQMSLKFRVKDSKINKESTNKYFKLFETVTEGDKNFKNYRTFLDSILSGPKMSKHGKLEIEVISSLLGANL